MILIFAIAAALGYAIGTLIFSPTQFVAFFENIVLLILRLIDIILMPLDYLIRTVSPNLNNALLQIVEYYDYAGQFMGWVLSALSVPSTALVLAASYFLFKWTVSSSAYAIKLVLSWKRALG